MGGPQIGYFYPGLTGEMDLHGPGWNARGATSGPFPGYILIGRREDFVWTLTSAGADIVDNYVETLCGGSDTKYLYRGQCRNMRHFNAGTLDGQPVEFNRTVHGPVIGLRAPSTAAAWRCPASARATCSTAWTCCCSSGSRAGTIPNAQTFIKKAVVTPQTFNTFYADDKHIAEVMTGRLPKRAPGRGRGPADRRPGQVRVARLRAAAARTRTRS